MPVTGLTVDALGNLYGTEVVGGTNGGGGVFDLYTKGQFVTLASPSAPALAGASDTGTLGDNITTATRPTLTGSAGVGATVTLYDGLVTLGSTTADSTGIWSFSAAIYSSAPLGVGLHTIAAKTSTGFGYQSVLSGTVGVTIAATTPPLVAITSFGIATANPNQAVSGTVTGPYASGAAITILDGGTVLATTAANASGNWTLNVPLSGDGAHTLTARATDTVGNVGTSASVFYTLDAKPPALTFSLVVLSAGQLSVTGGYTTSLPNGVSLTLYDGNTPLGTVPGVPARTEP